MHFRVSFAATHSIKPQEKNVSKTSQKNLLLQRTDQETPLTHTRANADTINTTIQKQKNNFQPISSQKADRGPDITH